MAMLKALNSEWNNFISDMHKHIHDHTHPSLPLVLSLYKKQNCKSTKNECKLLKKEIGV